MLTVSTCDPDSRPREGLRDILVDVALLMLAEEGAEALSLRAVARRSGVSAMAPYRHYPDKEALLAAVASRGFEGLREALLAADTSALPGQALVDQAVAYVGYARANPALFRLMFGATATGLHPERLAAGETAYAVLARRVATDTPEAGRDARTLGCWAMVHGLAMLFLDGRLAGSFPGGGGDATRQVAEVMLGGLSRAT